jgi:hypothetical protein
MIPPSKCRGSSLVELYLRRDHESSAVGKPLHQHEPRLAQRRNPIARSVFGDENENDVLVLETEMSRVRVV